MVARIDEKYSLMEQFPFLNRDKIYNYFDYTYDDMLSTGLCVSCPIRFGLSYTHHLGSEDGQMITALRSLQVQMFG